MTVNVIHGMSSKMKKKWTVAHRDKKPAGFVRVAFSSLTTKCLKLTAISLFSTPIQLLQFCKFQTRLQRMIDWSTEPAFEVEVALMAQFNPALAAAAA